MEKRNVFYSIVAFAIMLTLAMFTSCDKALEEFSLNVEPDSGPDTNTEVTITVTRDSENGKVTASKDVNGIRQDTTVIVPLGGCKFRDFALGYDQSEQARSVVGKHLPKPAATPATGKRKACLIPRRSRPIVMK